MNIHQEHLLELLKEIDAFCKEHHITYYCAGGTVIGAARHRGFIPWDDDIDIYMTRDNFGRFAEALEKYGPEDRILEYYEADHDRRAPVPRYHRETDTMFCHFHLLGRSSAGTSLDVFILDPIPDDHEARVDFYAKTFAYCDLIAPCHVYSHRLPVNKFNVYEKYKRIAEEEGIPQAIEKISEEIFRFDESDCSCYCLRWGSVILIYPIEVIGKPEYLPFEDMMIPVPHDWYRYLVIHYGMDWADLPYEEVQHEHVNILHYDRQYEYYYEKRDEMFSQEDLLDLHFRWKDEEREFYRAAEPIEAYVKEIQDRICKAEIEKKLKKAFGETGTSSLAAMFEAGAYEEVIAAYDPYLKLQLGHAYMGRQMRHGTQFRWLFPFIVPIAEKELEILLNTMLRTGRQRDAEKLVGIYRRGNVESEAINETAKVVDLINDVRKAYYLGNFEEAGSLVRESGLQDEIPALKDMLWLAEVQTGINESQAAELEAAAKSEGSSEAVCKAWGDYLWKNVKCYDAEKVYKKLMKTCRNGLFWLDIRSRIFDIDPIPTKRLTPFTDTDTTKKQRALLEEITGICRSNGIRYVLDPDLARRIYLTGNIGYVNSNREIIMDADNADRFTEAFKTADIKDRNLLSWKDNNVRDMMLLYCDNNSVYCDFRNLEKWRDIGTCITIRVLGSGSGLTGLKCKLLGRDASTIGANDMFYYTNIKGKRPVKHKFSRSNWEDTCEIEMEGIQYTVPTAVTKDTVPHETDFGNVPPIRSIFIYSSDSMSWDEISPLIDDEAYKELGWEDYFRLRKRFRKTDEKVRNIWQTMLSVE